MKNCGKQNKKEHKYKESKLITSTQNKGIGHKDWNEWKLEGVMHMAEFGSSSLALTLSKVDVSDADMLDECFSPCQKRAEVQ